jgi:hypothetical protein
MPLQDFFTTTAGTEGVCSHLRGWSNEAWIGFAVSYGGKGWLLWALAKRVGVTTASVEGSDANDRPATDSTQQPLNCLV